MTIITKPITDKKDAKKGTGTPLVVGLDGAENADSNINHNDLSQMEMELWLSPSVRRRISASTTVCVFVTALLLMSIFIIGGVYLYRVVAQHQRMSRFRGWCGIPFAKNSIMNSKNSPLFLHRPLKESDAEMMSLDSQFREEFDLDLDSDLFERIDVPDFGFGDRGQFIHDFKMNKTGIINVDAKRCYVMPLDRTHVKPPRSMYDLITRMWSGYYEVDMSVVRREMRVLFPPIQDLDTQGNFIAKNCEGFETFLLKDVAEMGAAPENGRERRSATKAFTVHEFVGNGLLQYVIQDY